MFKKLARTCGLLVILIQLIQYIHEQGYVIILIIQWIYIYLLYNFPEGGLNIRRKSLKKRFLIFSTNYCFYPYNTYSICTKERR